MNSKTAILLSSILVLLISCTKEPIPLDEETMDYSVQLTNEVVSIPVGDRTVEAYLTKPVGASTDLVLVLHGGTRTHELSLQATIGQYQKEDGGKLFLEMGMSIFALNYTEFDGPDDTVGVSKGYLEMEEVIAAIDYIRSGKLTDYNFQIQRLFAFGHSRGGANALLAGIERPLDGVISAEGPINWVLINDSIQSGYLEPTDKELHNYTMTTEAWGNPKDPNSDWFHFSPALKLNEFQSPFMVIQGYQDPAAIVEMAIEMQDEYETCSSCISGGQFVLHPYGHVDWAIPEVIESIRGFVK